LCAIVHDTCVEYYYTPVKYLASPGLGCYPVAMAGKQTGKQTDRQRGSAGLWLDGAYKALIEGGIDAVKVMPLAKALNLSRTSFYWHFEDREALLSALLARWQDKNTGNLVARTEAYAESISEAMFNLYDCWVDNALFDAEFDRAVRNWGLTSEAVQDMIQHADNTRRDAVKAMFLRYGFSGKQADSRAATVIYTQVGYIAMQVREPLEPRVGRMPDHIEIYTGQVPSAAEIRRFRARHGLSGDTHA
jgi:AcrR family transcriptional regulator